MGAVFKARMEVRSIPGTQNEHLTLLFVVWPFQISLVSFYVIYYHISCHVKSSILIVIISFLRTCSPQCLLGLIWCMKHRYSLPKCLECFLPHFTRCFVSPRYHNRMAPPCTNGTNHAPSQRGCREKRRGSNTRRQKIAVPKPSSTPYSGWRNATLERALSYHHDLSSTPFFILCPPPLYCYCLSCRRTTCRYSLIQFWSWRVLICWFWFSWFYL